MPATLRRESGNTYRLSISGVLLRRDLEAAEQSAADAIRRDGRIRLLVVLDGFAGWEPGMSWRDMAVYIRHGDAIERIRRLHGQESHGVHQVDAAQVPADGANDVADCVDRRRTQSWAMYTKTAGTASPTRQRVSMYSP